jgi:hypothetical protein
MKEHRLRRASADLGPRHSQLACPDFCHGLQARFSHRLPSRNGGDGAETRRATEAAAGVFDNTSRRPTERKRSLRERIRLCSGQPVRNAG